MRQPVLVRMRTSVSSKIHGILTSRFSGTVGVSPNVREYFTFSPQDAVGGYPPSGSPTCRHLPECCTVKTRGTSIAIKEALKTGASLMCCSTHHAAQVFNYLTVMSSPENPIKPIKSHGLDKAAAGSRGCLTTKSCCRQGICLALPWAALPKGRRSL